MNVNCPTCKKIGDWFAGPYGPFCSKRCKMVDLGKWFSEEHLISSPMPADDPENPSSADSPQETDKVDDSM